MPVNALAKLSRGFKRGVAGFFSEPSPGELLLEGRLPPTQMQYEALLKSQHLSDLLPYESYDEEKQLFYNDDGFGFVLECMPATGLSEEDLTVLSNLFTAQLPKCASIQISLIASPHVLPLLKRWANYRSADQHQAGENGRNSNLFRFMARKRVGYLLRGAWNSLFSDQAFLVRDFRLLVSVTVPACKDNSEAPVMTEQLIRARRTILSTLTSAHIAARAIDISVFIDTLDQLLNPQEQRRQSLQWQQDQLLSEQAVDAAVACYPSTDGIHLKNDEQLIDVRTFSVRNFPKVWAGWHMAELIGDMNKDSRRIPCPFMMTLTVHMPDYASAMAKAKTKSTRATQMADSPISRFVPVWGKRKRDWDFVQTQLDAGHNLVRVSYQVVLYAKHGEGDDCESSLKALYQSKGWMLTKNRFVALPAFLSALPFNAGSKAQSFLETFKMNRTFLTWSCSNVAPVIGEWKGTARPLINLLGRRGQLLQFSPWDNSQGNYNMAVMASSGSGKSFFTNECITSVLGIGGRVWAIDAGKSYENICRMLGGTFLEFTQDSAICLNPFTHVKNLSESIAVLKTLISNMASPLTPLQQDEKAYVEQAILCAWRQYGNKSTISHVAEYLTGHENTQARKVGTALYAFTKEGSYAKWFEGEANVDLNRSFVVLELQDLNSTPDLQAVVLMLLMTHITQSMYFGDRSVAKICIIDEAWRLMSRGAAADFIEEGYRTARKFGGAFMTITQSINDYYQSAVSRAALENADWRFYLRMKPEQIQMAEREGRFSFGEHGVELMKSVHTKAGQYSEILIESPDGMAIGRLVVDPFAEKLYSTKHDDYTAIAALQQQGYSLIDAVEHVAGQSLR